MNRKTRSMLLASATTVLVVGQAALFAHLRNRPGGLPAVPAMPPADDQEAAARPAVQPAAPVPAPVSGDPLALGRAAYERLRCGMCHAIAGQGNRNSPLDGVGARQSRAELRDWTIGAGSARERLPDVAARMKARYAQAADLEALLDYLASLR